MKIAIIGAGELGTAIAQVIRENNPDLSLWDADPAKIPGSHSLEESVSRAGIIFFCVPSWHMREAIESVLPYVPSDCGFVSCAKGIEESSAKIMPELFDEIAKEHPCAVIGGPMLAEEIVAGLPAVVVVASENPMLTEKLEMLFRSPHLRIQALDDPATVALVGVLKNVYAVSLGIADGLNLSGNEKGWLVSCAIAEMMAIITKSGMNSGILLGAAGVGDLIATGYSSYSRNRAVGDEIVKTGTCKLRGEGLASLPGLRRRLGGRVEMYPLLDLVWRVGIDCEPARPAFEKFFALKA